MAPRSSFSVPNALLRTLTFHVLFGGASLLGAVGRDAGDTLDELDEPSLLSQDAEACARDVEQPDHSPAGFLRASHEQRAGHVKIVTNDMEGNAVVHDKLATDGPLPLANTYPTGGIGRSSGLGSQGSVAMSHDGTYLAAVNAGSSSISLFAVHVDGSLELLETQPSVGVSPISVTIDGDTLYAVHDGDNSLAGMHIRTDQRRLEPILYSKRSLIGVAPGQVQFTPN